MTAAFKLEPEIPHFLDVPTLARAWGLTRKKARALLKALADKHRLQWYGAQRNLLTTEGLHDALGDTEWERLEPKIRATLAVRSCPIVPKRTQTDP